MGIQRTYMIIVFIVVAIAASLISLFANNQRNNA